MGTPDGMGCIALLCFALFPALLLIRLIVKAVRSFRSGDRREGLRYCIAFAAISALIAAFAMIFARLA